MTTASDSAEPPVTCLMLSGGSHRASLGSVGVLTYLAESGRLYQITDIISISGASMTNAALMADRPADIDDMYRVLGGFIDRVVTDRLRPWRTGRRILVTLATLAALAAVVAVVVGVLVIAASRGGVSVFLAAGVVLAAVPAVLMIYRLGRTQYVRDYITTLVGGERNELQLGGFAGDWPVQRHVISAAGLSSGTAYALQTGGTPLGPATLTAGYTPADAAFASGSLVGTGYLRAPESFGGEFLIDGGVLGVFGEQLVAASPDGTDQSPLRHANTLFVDAMRHPGPLTPTENTRTRRSVISLLVRWLKISVDATYRNDLIDAGPRRLVRLCDSRFIHRGNLNQVRDAGSVATEWAATSAVQHSVDRLRDAVATMSTTGLTAADADRALACGVLATAEHFGELPNKSTAIDLLEVAGTRLGRGRALVEAWSSLDSDAPKQVSGQDRYEPVPVNAIYVHPHQPELAEPLEVVWAAPGPRSANHIVVDEERTAIETTPGIGSFHVVDNPSLADVAKLSHKRAVVHIAAHAEPRSHDSPAALLFETSLGDAERVTGQQLAEALDVALVVVTASGSADLLSSVGDLAMVGMTRGLTDNDAVEFTTSLYRSLASGYSVEQAVIAANAPRQFDAPIDIVARKTGVAGYALQNRLATTGVWLSFARRRSIQRLTAPAVGAGDFTVLAWIRRDTDPSGRNSGHFADTRGRQREGPGWVMGGYHDGRLLFQLHRGTETSTDEASMSRSFYNYWSGPRDQPARSVFDGRWHLVAASVDRDGDVVLSIDGTEENRQHARFRGVDVTGPELLVGTAWDHYDHHSHHFNGDLAELVVVPEALSLDDVGAIWREPPNGVETAFGSSRR